MNDADAADVRGTEIAIEKGDILHGHATTGWNAEGYPLGEWVSGRFVGRVTLTRSDRIVWLDVIDDSGETWSLNADIGIEVTTE